MKNQYRWSLKLFYLKIILLFKKAFLPSGYPHTVSDDYLQYQLWDSVQAFASSIMNNMATQAVFKGVGVGDANATVLAATITWLLKDGTSIIGSLIFATRQSTKMDSYCKRWRLFADILNDVAICIDLLSPSFGQPFFSLMQCLSAIMRSLVGIAGGATRAALTQHQAKCNNLADVCAKDGSQERMVNLAALACSLLLIPLVSDRILLIWSLFTVFTALHVFANYRAIKSVSIDVFNASRLANFFEHHFELGSSNENEKPDYPYSVAYVNLRENVWFFNTTDRFDRYFERVSLCYVPDREALLRTQIDARSAPIYRFVDARERFAIVENQAEDSYRAYIVGEQMGLRNVDDDGHSSTQLLIEILFHIFVVRFCQRRPLGEHMPRYRELNSLINSIIYARQAHTEANSIAATQIVASSVLISQLEPIRRKMIAAKWNLSHLLLAELFEQDIHHYHQQEDEQYSHLLAHIKKDH